MVRTGIVLITLLVGVFSLAAHAEIRLTPQWTERYLFKHYPALLENSHTDHVLAFYYFGSYKKYTVMGMERVKGDDYTAYNTTLIFKDSVLTGYYPEMPVFPAGIEEGGVFFPHNTGILSRITLESNSYPDIKIDGKDYSFIPVSQGAGNSP